MKLNPGLGQAVQIFKELGWHRAPREQAPTLPLGTQQQQRAALAGLKTGDWGEFAQTGTDSYGWVSAIDVNEGMLGLFAIRLGVDARRGEQLARGDDDALLACLKQRGEKYAAAFIARACRSNRRAWEHSLSVFGTTAVSLVCRLGLEVPRSVEYLKDWAAIALAGLTGDRSETQQKKQLPPLDDLLPSFEAHLTAAIELGLPTTGPLGRVLPAAVRQGLVARNQAVGLSFAGLDAAVRPGDRKKLAEIVVEDLAVTDSELLSRTEALIPLLATGQAPLIEAFAPRLIAGAPPDLVGEVALPALYAKTAKAVRIVLAALSQRGGIAAASMELLADRLGELASGRDKATAQAAGALLVSWGVAGRAPAPGSPEIRGLWRPTPPLWQVPRFDAGEPSTAALTEALRAAAYLEEGVHHLGIDRFLTLAVALANISLDDVKRALAGVPRDFSAVRRWLNGEPTLPTYRRDGCYLHHELVLEHLGKIPCLLSEPSFDDQSVQYADLVSRLERYADIGAPVLHTDLVLALARVDTRRATAGALPSGIGVKLDDGSLLDRDAATIITEYLADPLVEPDLAANPHVAFSDAGSLRWPNSLRGMAPSLRHQLFRPITPGQVPHWGDAALSGLWWTGEVDYEVGMIALQAASRATPLLGGGAMNLLAVQRPNKVGIAAEVAQALNLAWERGLLLPGRADVKYLDWSGELANLASLAAALVEVAETGLLSVVWPVLDELLTASLAGARLAAGTAEIASAMELLAGEVLAAVASGVAPQSALEVPGLRALAAHSGTSKAVVAARAAVQQLPERSAPVPAAVPSLQVGEFEAIWPQQAGRNPRIKDGAQLSAYWPVSTATSRHIGVNLYLPDYPGEVFQVVKKGWFYDLAHEGQVQATRVTKGDVGPVAEATMRDGDPAHVVWLHWDGTALVVSEHRNWRQNTRGSLVGAATALSDSLIAVLIANLATEAEVYAARGTVRQLAESGSLGAAAVSAAVTALVPHPAWSPARAVYELESAPQLLASLWPLLTETLRYAAAQDVVPRWANRVLDIVTLHAPILAEASRRGYLPAAAWAGIAMLASRQGSATALKKARELHATFG